MKIALIAGSTGLIGKQLLRLLLDSPHYSRVIALTRRPLGETHPKLLEIVTDLKGLDEQSNRLACDDVFCCLGTTMAKAGSKEKFYEADFEYPVKLARLAKSQGAKQYLLVSALGADKSSSIYYNRVKGEVEEAIIGTGFETIHVVRPSLLLGDRSESRPGEEAAKVFFKYFGFLVPSKYKGIDALKVANAMLHFAVNHQQGTFIHESRELQAF